MEDNTRQDKTVSPSHLHLSFSPSLYLWGGGQLAHWTAAALFYLMYAVLNEEAEELVCKFRVFARGTWQREHNKQMRFAHVCCQLPT